MPKRKYFSAKSEKDALQKAEKHRQKYGTLKGNSFYRLPNGEEDRVRLKDDGRLSAEDPATKDKADAKRKSFEQPSTDLAHQQNLEDKKLRKQINNEASLYELERIRTEHLANQRNSANFSSGAPGDPINQIPITEKPAQFKNKLEKQAAKLGAGVTIDPANESFKVIPDKFFDPIADPGTLPGVDVPFNSSLDNLASDLKKVVIKQGKGLSQLVFKTLKNINKTMPNPIPVGSGEMDEDLMTMSERLRITPIEPYQQRTDDF